MVHVLPAVVFEIVIGPGIVTFTGTEEYFWACIHSSTIHGSSSLGLTVPRIVGTCLVDAPIRITLKVKPSKSTPSKCRLKVV